MVAIGADVGCLVRMSETAWDGAKRQRDMPGVRRRRESELLVSKEKKGVVCHSVCMRGS